jgi:hypothetical protein
VNGEQFEKNGEDPAPRHISEFVDEAMRELTRPHDVKLDRQDRLTFREAPDYEIDARELDTHRGLCDWLWHLAVTGKRWFTMQCLLDLLATVRERARRRDAQRNANGQPSHRE